jgi:anti-sigma factor RsiW
MSHQHPHPPEDCREIFARLSEYLDGELPPEAAKELESHLCACPPCVEFVRSLRRTVDLCHGFDPGLGPAPLPAEVRERLLAACRGMLAARRTDSIS